MYFYQKETYFEKIFMELIMELIQLYLLISNFIKKKDIPNIWSFFFLNK